MERVGLDYLPATTHAPGVGRYARELVRALVAQDARDDGPRLALFEVGGAPRTIGEPALGLVGHAVDRRLSRTPRRVVRLLGRLGRGADRWLGGVDLFHHVLAGALPVTNAAECVAIAELPVAGSAAARALAALAARGAGAVVFGTEMRARASERFGFAPERVHLTPVGCDHWARDLSDARVGAAEPATHPRILVLGGVRIARSPQVVLEAFELLRAGGIDAELVLAGHAGDAAHAFEVACASSPAQGRVRWIRAPRESEMPALVAGSSLLCHLAADEGTPVTPLEAFSLGLPVVATRLPVFEEALGSEAAYVPPRVGARPLADALAAALTGPTPDRNRAAARRAIATSYTWDACARATVRAWRALLSASS